MPYRHPSVLLFPSVGTLATRQAGHHDAADEPDDDSGVYLSADRWDQERDSIPYGRGSVSWFFEPIRAVDPVR